MGKGRSLREVSLVITGTVREWVSTPGWRTEKNPKVTMRVLDLLNGRGNADVKSVDCLRSEETLGGSLGERPPRDRGKQGFPGDAGLS